eukprot:CAMPEP_0114510974 /NCGR_PEP_ID=MMETSP0109-20121206/14099_1 /TAXON_ID=29199 /ORGANISM="Chlorarachnion reptans, Strain CCCM449" /LENGTH=429 /DNA_ID=CAMNT_0001690369 /DNA_START=10 /DNA_END=1299 /DNA_ORIENTATION=-
MSDAEPMATGGEREEDEEYVNPSKGSIGLRAKKFLASKTAGSALGQKLINSLLGPKSQRIVSALTGIACELRGKKDAKSAQNDLYKIATKFRILVKDKKLNRENTKDLEEPLHRLGVKILDALSKKKINNESVQKIHKAVEMVRKTVSKKMKDHMQEKNFKKLQNLFDIYGDVKFLNIMLNEEKYATEKKDLYENLSLVLKEQMVELEKLRSDARLKVCEAYQCKNPSLRADGKFKGSKFCAFHHREWYDKRILDPKLFYFVEENEASAWLSTHLRNLPGSENKEFGDALKGVQPITIFNFLRTERAYQTLDRGLRQRRAEIIIRKYLTAGVKNFINVDKKMLEEMHKAMDQSDHRTEERADEYPRRQSIVYGATPKDLFSKVSSQAMERLDVVFKKSFLGSTEHEQYKNMVTLPESLVKLAKEQAVVI